MALDWRRAREDTPGCRNVLHFNNAGAALMPTPVIEALTGHIELEAAIGGYEAAARAEDRIEHTYAALAALVGCAPDEIAVVENATRAWDMAFYALPLGPGDRILTALAEYASNYIAYLQVAARTGAVVEAVPNDGHGQISVEALRQMIDERVKLVSITHVPTNGGLVNPAAEVGRVAREAGIPYLLDACQSVGQMAIDVDEIGCDMLSATARKYLRGPRGAGFLYVRRSMLERLEPPFLDLHAAEWRGAGRYELRPDARRFENWEGNVAGKIALGVAADYALGWGLDAIEGRVCALARALRARLGELPGVVVHDLGQRRCGIVSFSAQRREAGEIERALGARAINVSTSSVASTRLDMEARGLADLVRASVHYYNSEDEVTRFADELARLL